MAPRWLWAAEGAKGPLCLLAAALTARAVVTEGWIACGVSQKRCPVPDGEEHGPMETRGPEGLADRHRGRELPRKAGLQQRDLGSQQTDHLAGHGEPLCHRNSQDLPTLEPTATRTHRDSGWNPVPTAQGSAAYTAAEGTRGQAPAQTGKHARAIQPSFQTVPGQVASMPLHPLHPRGDEHPEPVPGSELFSLP